MKQRVRIISMCLLTLILIRALFLVLFYFLQEYTWIELPVNQSIARINEYSLAVTFLFIVFIGPFIEECVFRLPLRFSPVNLGISAFFLSHYLHAFFTGVRLNSMEGMGGRLVVASFVFILVYSIFYPFRKWIKYDEGKGMYIQIIVFSLLFGLSHLVNYNCQNLTFLSILLIVTPHIISGIVYAFIRVKQGFGFVLFVHILFNGLGFIFVRF